MEMYWLLGLNLTDSVSDLLEFIFSVLVPLVLFWNQL